MKEKEVDLITLQEQKDALLEENIRLKEKPKSRIGVLFIVFGLIMASLSIDYNNNMIAFFSLALIFWGGIYLYIRPTRYIKQEILYSSIEDLYANYNQLVKSLGYKGKPHYVASKSLEGLKDVNLIIPKNSRGNINHFFDAMDQNEAVKPEILNLVPPGSGLSKLMEKEAKTNFATLELDHLMALIGKILTEDLELINGLEANIANHLIQLKLTPKDIPLNRGGEEIEQTPMIQWIIESIAVSAAKSTQRGIFINKTSIEKRVIEAELGIMQDVWEPV